MAWFILLAALLLKFTVPEVESLFNLIITFIVLYLFFKLKTIIHECGHLVAGYWAGAIPKRMILGTGHEVYRTEWNGVKIVLKSIPIGGRAIALFNELPFIRLRFAFFILGGVLFNILAALIFYFLFGYDSSFLLAAHGIDLASCFIFANLLGVTNLIPFYTSYYGTSMPTDGLSLLQIVFGSYKKNFQNLKHSEDYFQSFECFEKRDYDKA
ncbi:MAG TPA: site-2 protease family protein, partial [Chryseolinea sp.]|nr:site-2 protease family protein [Chryseolinea sp.]